MWSTRYPTRSQWPDSSHTHQPPRIRKRRRPSVWQRSLLSAGLVAILGGTGVWLTEALIAPQASQAYTSRLDLFLARESGETYDTLLRRAEMAARAGAQRSFDQDLLTTNVSVNVVVESEGITVPILALRVDREEWRTRPETYYWATYYRTAESLLNAPPGAFGL
ncbi:MAG: hypothetical protein AAGB19_16255 [Cyanobacteria bacterium P01_F01_bin.3]